MAEMTALAVVGMSATDPCGMRDHATVLAGALAHEHVSCSMHWVRRPEGSLRSARADLREWTRALELELEQIEADAVLLHYSAFAYAHRGVPLLLGPVLSAVRSTGLPLVTLMHEFAYGWQLGAWRTNVWALSQRAVLIELMRASRAAIVTTDFRAEWLTSRRWLPTRPVAVAPVFSNLPAPDPGQRPQRGLLGLFGYAYQGAAASLVLDALRLLADRGVDARLSLLGAPGAGSPPGRAWQQGARDRGLAPALSFTGTLAAGELSNALAGCEVLLSAASPGPTSRKGTLAASLASGRPVVALDGPRTWQELVLAEAAEVVAPHAAALADALAALLADEARCEALGARGRAFAEQRLSVAYSAEVVAETLAAVLGRRDSQFSRAA
ncbi:MAG TPA: glycosyltransferase [Solirubrobacteraceae bacterium]|jgi:hypothetical protein|nr:glycosyltransferase [Solirubrobacteraceae bacterium]